MEYCTTKSNLDVATLELKEEIIDENVSDINVSFPKKMSVRSYFIVSNVGGKKVGACNICQKTIKMKDSNTTGLKRHLQNKHKKIFLKNFANSNKSVVNKTVLSLSRDQDKSEKNISDDNSEDEEQYVTTKLTQPNITRKAPELKRKQDTNASCSYSGSNNQSLKTFHDDKPIRDEFSIFGEMVAYKIRNLPTKYARSTVQHLFNNILYDADLGKYDHPPGNPINTSRKRVDMDCSNIANQAVFVEDNNDLFEEENVDSPSSTVSNTFADSDYIAQVKSEIN